MLLPTNLTLIHTSWIIEKVNTHIETIERKLSIISFIWMSPATWANTVRDLAEKIYFKQKHQKSIFAKLLLPSLTFLSSSSSFSHSTQLSLLLGVECFLSLFFVEISVECSLSFDIYSRNTQRKAVSSLFLTPSSPYQYAHFLLPFYALIDSNEYFRSGNCEFHA